MFSSKINFATLAIFILCTVTLFVQADITVDAKQKIPKKLGSDEGAILIVGNVADIAISADNIGSKNGTENSSKQANPSSAVCHGLIDKDSQTYEGPCLLSIKESEQGFHAKCLKGKGSASITFYKDLRDGKSVEVQAVDGIWAGFSNKKPLKQGTLHTNKRGVKVILNCDNDKSKN